MNQWLVVSDGTCSILGNYVCKDETWCIVLIFHLQRVTNVFSALQLCQRGLAMRKYVCVYTVSVCLTVRLSNAWIVAKTD